MHLCVHCSPKSFSREAGSLRCHPWHRWLRGCLPAQASLHSSAMSFVWLLSLDVAMRWRGCRLVGAQELGEVGRGSARLAVRSSEAAIWELGAYVAGASGLAV